MRRFFILCLYACSAAAPPEPRPGCNPLVGDDCLSPFPSQFFQTPTAVRIPDGVLPLQVNGLAVSPARINQKPGFSPNTPFFVYFKEGVDGANLPGPDQSALTLTAQSPVQVLRASDGVRVPVMAELDMNALPGDRQALIVRPLQPLVAGERYLIALTGLKDARGRSLEPAPFVALRDRTTLSKALAAIASQYEDVFARLEKAGVARASLTLAWDVTIGLDDHLSAMRDQALAMTSALTVTRTTDTPNDPNLLRQIEATVQVPMYLDEDEAFLSFDKSGRPTVRTTADVPILINIPQCSKTSGPLPLVVFGHGLFLDARTSLNSRAMQALGNRPCAVWAATDWLGLSTADVAPLATSISEDLNHVYRVMDRLQQAQVNHLVMTRTLLGQLAGLDGHAYYFGISNGGIQGVGLMKLSPDLSRAVLNVPGANWSLLIWRSTDFNGLKPLVTSLLPDAFDAQIYIGLLQSEWDYVDPASFAAGLTADKRILMQESLGDAQVTNLSTRYLARTMAIPGMAPLGEVVFGIDTMAAPLDSAYTQWNSHSMPLPPPSNTSLPMDTAAHNAVWSSDKAEQQIEKFLKEGGQVEDVCGGVPCDT